MEFLQSIDRSLFILINQTLATAWLDPLMKGVTLVGRVPWVFGVVWLALVIKGDHKIKQLCFLMIPLLVMSDMIPTYILKPLFGRLRPVFSLEEIRPVLDQVGKIGLLSFPSNHATNIFAIGTLVSLFYRSKKVVFGCLGLAVLIGYSRVYVGAHYPFDVLAGAVLGISLAFLVYQAYKRYVNKEKQ